MTKNRLTFSKILLAICWFLAIVISFCLTACAVSEKPPKAKNDSQYLVTLDANNTTGYQWELTIAGESIVKCVEEKYITDTTDEPRGGTPCKQYYLFESVSKDETTVVFTYEFYSDEREPLKTVTMNAVVDENGKLTMTEIS